MRLTRRGWLLLGALVFVGTYAPAWAPSLLVYAPSASMPKGWYLRAFPERPLHVGDIVVLKTPEQIRGVLPAEIPDARLLKAVAALAGAQACWWRDGMSVTATDYTGWYPRQTDVQAATLLNTCQTVGADETVLVGWHPRSFDSRYVGMIPLRLVQFRVWPLWTWEGP